MKELDFLNELQNVDLALDGLRARLVDSPEQRELKELEKGLVIITTELRKSENNLEKEETKQKKLEGEIELLDLKIKKEEKRLFSGTVANPKELTGLQAEIKMLGKQKDEMETELLEQLEVVEGLSKENKGMKVKLAGISANFGQAKTKYQQVIQESEAEIKKLEDKRLEIKPTVPAELLGTYQKLRNSKLTKAVVSLTDETCQGCYVTLPAEEVDKMLSQDKLWHCPNCRRILIIKS